MVDQPLMLAPHQVTPDVDVLPAYFPIPGFGTLAVNAFVLKADEPLLVDSGLVPLSDEFMQHLSTVIDPGDLRWLWLTHCHLDHLGSLQRILAAAPRLQVITTFLGVGIMSLFQPLPLDRVYLLNPGQKLNLGDRVLSAVTPPSFDSPETVGFYESRTRAFFCSDCFGALLSEPVVDAADVGSQRLREGMVTWATIDSPWLHMVDRAVFAERLDGVREMAPGVILSSHLPVARGMTDTLLRNLASVPDAKPFVGPDQAGLMAMLEGQKAA